MLEKSKANKGLEIIKLEIFNEKLGLIFYHYFNIIKSS